MALGWPPVATGRTGFDLDPISIFFENARRQSACSPLLGCRCVHRKVAPLSPPFPHATEGYRHALNSWRDNAGFVDSNTLLVRGSIHYRLSDRFGRGSILPHIRLESHDPPGHVLRRVGYVLRLVGVRFPLPCRGRGRQRRILSGSPRAVG